MDIGDYIFWTVYPLGYLFSTWRIGGQFAWSEKSSFHKVPQGDDVVMGIIFGGMLSVFWPVALPIALMISSGNNLPRLLWTPKEKKLEIAKERIKELEREVGIR